MSERTIFVIGNANLDLVTGCIDDWPEPGTEIFLPQSDFRTGGSAANTALALQRLQHPCGFLSAVGSDSAGRMIAQQFSGPLDRVAALPLRTSISVGILHACAERTFFSTNGHLDRLDLAFFQTVTENVDMSASLALLSGAFTMPALLPDHDALLRSLRERGAETAIDPGWPGEGWTPEVRSRATAWLERADHVLLNEKETAGLAAADTLDEALIWFAPRLRKGARLIVKRGPEGALCLCDGTVVECGARDLSVFDTVGAGDAFNAGYLHAVASGAPIRQALARGIDVAGRVISEFPRSSSPLEPAA
ncbi:carbohydrate kinase family protein [uncultured Nitratireductor sp.]|uniref:carbohydrate kinase family protein n=1 Tax=uncultured Nitratireductor sp. TaxID=520953 RepID=UPI0025F7BB52|nr:carbohydrate kinase family protein [uncultured Nitratireductor sp.]